jgi:hypothetical protein
MKTGQVIALVLVAVVITLAAGATIGYFVATGSSQAPLTMTKIVMISPVAAGMLVVCGTSTIPGATMQIVNVTSTSYLLPQSIINNTAGEKFLRVAVVTSTSSQSSFLGVSSYEVTMTSTYTSTQNGTTACPTFA